MMPQQIDPLVDGYAFTGFHPISTLQCTISLVPDNAGVYLVLRPPSEIPDFIECGTGGRFKGRDPNQSVDILTGKWVLETSVIYIGKAGGTNSRSTLRTRLNDYFRFGAGKPVGHWGGRYIWQIPDAPQLLVAWHEILPDGETPRQVEQRLILRHKEIYGHLPFANLRH